MFSTQPLEDLYHDLGFFQWTNEASGCPDGPGTSYVEIFLQVFLRLRTFICVVMTELFVLEPSTMQGKSIYPLTDFYCMYLLASRSYRSSCHQVWVQAVGLIPVSS
ncbi:hypothetical protein ATANTOWER_002749 [Ataeniobius toweri]|uniref:Uncharacterized protein n=1 Tax=Ataeniobius toweri TaxID=208326 RepID=A0ABU7BEA5_9TELE|nr:hypothetical protein [Ataeniobius toweri]